LIPVEQVTESCAYHGEGPVWDFDAGVLHWVDMLAGDVLTLDTGSGAVARMAVGEVAAALRPRAQGGLVIANERGFCLLDRGETRPRQVAEAWTDPAVRMNEGGCDPQGRFYCGSMAYDASPGRGALYRFDTDGSVSQVLDAVTISNGIAWTHDGTHVYYIDSPTQRVDVFDFEPDEGRFRDRRPVVEVDADDGLPDGMTLDAEGGLWVAIYNGGAVHRYTPEGRLDAVVEPGPRRVTACTFGGDDLGDLYITTSREGLSPDEQPTAGALFRCRPGVQGVPALTYAG
jgi:sugar lactone lactonase YvrE